MTKFNLSKFNIKSGSKESVTGNSTIEIDSSIKDAYAIKSSGKAESNITVDGSIDYTVRKFGKADDNAIEINTSIEGTVQKFSGKTSSGIEIDCSAISSLLGIDDLQLSNQLSLRPGQTLEIDLCDLTVTIDGENAVHVINIGSDWFDILPSKNELTISCNGTIDSEVFWKDRWL